MRTQRNGPVLVLILCVSGISGAAIAQVPNGAQLPNRPPVPSTATGFPPAGYSRGTMQPVPAVGAGPSLGATTAGGLSLPSGPAPAVSGTYRTPPAGTAMNPLSGSPYQQRYWSPRTAVWDIQAQLGRQLGPTAPTGASGQAAVPTATSGLPSGMSQLQGLSGSQGALDPLARYRGPASLPLPTTAAEPPEAAPVATQEVAEPFQNDLGVPFDQFESYEEFREWLTEQVTQPGGGAVGQALARLEGMDQPPSAGADQPAGRGQPAQRRGRQPVRPPIGYVGIGSNAQVPLGLTSVGPDAAMESSRIAATLNQYLRDSQQSRVPRRSAGTAPGEGPSAGQLALPPPRSSLGRTLRSSSQSSRPYSARDVQGYAPGASQVQPRSYYQNLGGYQPPQPALDWLPPGAGY